MFFYLLSRNGVQPDAKEDHRSRWKVDYKEAVAGTAGKAAADGADGTDGTAGEASHEVAASRDNTTAAMVEDSALFLADEQH